MPPFHFCSLHYRKSMLSKNTYSYRLSIRAVFKNIKNLREYISYSFKACMCNILFLRFQKRSLLKITLKNCIYNFIMSFKVLYLIINAIIYASWKIVLCINPSHVNYILLCKLRKERKYWLKSVKSSLRNISLKMS